MVIVDEANLSVMTWSSRTCRNVTKVAAYCRTFREFQRKDRPIPESVVEIDRDGATVRERIGAAASTQTECGCDSGYLVARRSNVAVERLQSRRCACTSFVDIAIPGFLLFAFAKAFQDCRAPWNQRGLIRKALRKISVIPLHDVEHCFRGELAMILGE
jgi:hypothetical protein